MFEVGFFLLLYALAGARSRQHRLRVKYTKSVALSPVPVCGSLSNYLYMWFPHFQDGSLLGFRFVGRRLV